MPQFASLILSVLLALQSLAPTAMAEESATTQPAQKDEAAATQPAEGDQPATTQPAATQPATPPADDAAPPLLSLEISPELDALLDRLEAATQKLNTIKAKVTYDRIQGLLGDEQRRFGTLVYIAGPPAKFSVHLDRLLVDGAARSQDRRYIFDGRWLVEQVVEADGAKRFTKWQLVGPDADPADMDPLGKGDGPFALPIRINKAQLLQRFTIEHIEPTEDDPRIHLALTPRNPKAVDFARLEIWYESETLLPSQVYTLDDVDSENETIIKLRDIEANVEVDPSVIDTSEPTDRGWRIEVKPWQGE